MEEENEGKTGWRRWLLRALFDRAVTKKEWSEGGILIKRRS
jgi:hypothetical protein